MPPTPFRPGDPFPPRFLLVRFIGKLYADEAYVMHANWLLDLERTRPLELVRRLGGALALRFGSAASWSDATSSLCYVFFCFVRSYQVVLCPVVLCPVVLCCVISCRVMSWRVMSCCGNYQVFSRPKGGTLDHGKTKL